MLFYDKKKALSAILGPDKDEMEGGGEEAPSDLHSIANDLINAVHSKDTAGVAECLSAAHYACGGMVGEKGE